MKIQRIIAMAAGALLLGVSACDTGPNTPGGGVPAPQVLNKKGVEGNGKVGGNECVQYTTATGCTRTQGYWKNHANWPCPYTPDGYICGKTKITLFEGLTTPPDGNPYWILAQQYVPALLNKTSNLGNIPPEIQALIDEARLFFLGRDPDSPLDDALRARVLEIARLLDEFNNGLGGLPHCG